MAEEKQQPAQGRQPWVPVPDPTLLTTDLLRREIAALEDKLNLMLAGVRQVFEARIDGMDRAQGLLASALQTHPTEVDSKVESLRDVFDSRLTAVDERIQQLSALQVEKFLSVEGKFQERDVRADKLAEQSALAVNAALQAAEKAVGKNEVVTAKLLDQQSTLLQTETGSIRVQLLDVKDRVTRIEGQAIGQMGAKGEQHTTTGTNISVIGTVIGILALLMSVAAMLIKFGGR